MAANAKENISIHALREEGDRSPTVMAVTSYLFLSTPSARRATFFAVLKWHRKLISIHALREEGDSHQKTRSYAEFDFYPRPPRGGRP